MCAALLRSRHYRNDMLRYNASDVVNDSSARLYRASCRIHAYIHACWSRFPAMGEECARRGDTAGKRDSVFSKRPEAGRFLHPFVCDILEQRRKERHFCGAEYPFISRSTCYIIQVFVQLKIFAISLRIQILFAIIISCQLFWLMSLFKHFIHTNV